VDRVPETAFASGINTAFREIGSGTALIGCRPGLTVVNTTALAVTTPGTNTNLDFARLFTYDTGTTYSNFLPVINRDGRLYYKDSTNAFTAEVTVPSAWGATSGTKCFTAGDFAIDGTVFNNRLFLIKQSATPELRSFTGTSTAPTVAVPWGLSPIGTVAVTAVAGGASLPTGETYDVAITSYHSTTGAESSLSASIAVTPTAGQRIQVTITPTAAESALYTNWRVYLRRRSTQSRLYLVSSLGTGGNIAIGTTTVYVDLTAAQITALTTAAPSTVENNPPPASAKFVCTYGRRVLVADERNVYWSKQDKADNFPPLNYEPIETGEGDTITGIYPFSEELALVFTTTAIWGIYGNDPQTWAVKPIDHTIGCLSHLSIIEFNGQLGWWSDAYGPVVFDGTTITRLGERELGRDSYTSELNLNRLAYSWAGHDPKYGRIIWAVPGVGATRNTRMFVYNYQVGKFESEKWDPMPAACLATGYSSDGSLRLFLGNDRGQLFYFNESVHNDGVPSGTVSGTFVGAGALSTISGTGFYTDSGENLAGRWVLIVDSDARPVTKVEIASSTSTTLTLATSPSLTVGPTYTYYIGSPDFRLGTRAYDMGRTFFRKRFDRLYVHIKAASGGADNVFLTSQVNFSATQDGLGEAISLGGAKWNAATSLWNSSIWVGEQNIKKRLPLFITGQNLQLNLFQFMPSQDVVVSTVGVLAGAQSERYYG
jgi:hypothetical protein